MIGFQKILGSEYFGLDFAVVAFINYFAWVTERLKDHAEPDLNSERLKIAGAADNYVAYFDLLLKNSDYL